MRKKIFIFVIVFLVTGCNVTYNLNIDNTFSENVSVIQKNSVKGDGIFEKVFKTVNSDIPLYSNSTDYNYSVIPVDDGVDLGLILDGRFKGNNSESYAVSQACEDYTIEKKNNIVTLMAKNFYIFDDYDNLDLITVNIDIKNEVFNNNADSVNGSVYTWVISKYNYSDKKILLSYKNRDSKESAFDNTNGVIVNFGIIIFVLIICGTFIYFTLRIVFKRKNSL